MPSRYVVRSFAENTYYHVFNRGVEKRKIFEDKQDYQIFEYYLFIYLAPLEDVLKVYPNLPLRLQSKNLSGDLDLTAYCLMPNHLHFLLKQTSVNATSKFMKQLTNAYTLYFNNKYQRIGGLMQGRFKAALVNSDEYLIHLSRYIHLNPLVANLVINLKVYKWSSYLSYVDQLKNDFCEKEIILSQFPSVKAYEEFVLDQADYGKELKKLKHLTIDD